MRNVAGTFVLQMIDNNRRIKIITPVGSHLAGLDVLRALEAIARLT